MSDLTIYGLDDRTVLRILSEATMELREGLPEAERSRAATEDEARAALVTLLDLGGQTSRIDAVNAVATPGAARALLSQLLADPATRAIVAPVVSDPPEDTQKSIELATSGAIVLGALIAWLQTSFELVVQRKDGKTDFSFRMRKKDTSADLLSATAKAVENILTR
ncbi:MAG TPA: hypothetical protein VGC79_30560 [Polyangiaceae bacterium]